MRAPLPIHRSLVAALLAGGLAACGSANGESPAGAAGAAAPGAPNPAAAPSAPPPRDPRLAQIELPPGFHIELVTDQLPGARSLALSPGRTVFVGTRSEGRVYALRLDEAWRAGQIHLIADGLNQPNGVVFHDGDLYVAEVSRLLRYAGIEPRLADPPAPEVVFADLPSDRSHGWKYLERGPDGKLYFGIGAPCNICDQGDPYASIARLDPAAPRLEIVARGVRNTVGFDWHPRTGELWFTDNGRDRMGDDVPPDELNRLGREGQHFGYPYCHGGDVADPEFGEGRPCSDFVPPAAKLGPHVAALGMLFYRGDMFPAEYRGDVFIAEHGSWNRSAKIGYRVTVLDVEGDTASGYRPFAAGWLQGEEAWGRPVDLLELPDGSLLLSDDELGAIYRITYDRESDRSR